MQTIANQIYDCGIVPSSSWTVEDAVPLANALTPEECAVSVTFRTACAEEAIRAIAKQVPDMLVGAGTVLTRSRPSGPSTAPSLSSAQD